MSAVSLLPKSFWGSASKDGSSKPGWFNRQVTPVLQSVSRRACTHPIHTIVFIALLASTTYIGLLEGSLFDTSVAESPSRRTGWKSLVEGSKSLQASEETAWRWQVEDRDPSTFNSKVRIPCRSGSIP
jgi:hydroxymethylglutaryl-CoA reductase (NADPH)